jgi:hypothetical protein
MKIDPVRTVIEPAPLTAPQRAAATESEAGERALFGAKGFGFHTLLEIVNPLQHIPLVGTLYREVTGDTISPAGRIAGGGLFGGVFGFIGSVLSSIFEGLTGKDPAAMVVSALRGETGTTDVAGRPAAPAATALASYQRAAELSYEDGRTPYELGFV